MPRKAVKTEKPPLLFLERSLCGARLQNVPEVRAALNPKDFFTETQEHNSSTLKSWTRSRDQSHQPKSTRTKKATECSAVSDVGNQPLGSCRIKRTVSSAQYSDTPKRKTSSLRKGNGERLSDGAASSSRFLDPPETLSIHVTGIPPDGASTPASNTFSTTEVSSVGPPPDVDTPKVMQEGSSSPSSTPLHLLLPQLCTPPCNQPPDILVADTPERDYGVKVTWRRRRGLMLLLKERGHLSASDTLIHR
ncbi:RAD9, HUS1, RAD1-interacting nuclear orphan protein 1 isoform X2 [Micropterus dolomieu]|uniref:RAD9, HUS1, RAD1-interacting nuclear orphan protein 1 isoform X2 n=1 Tax=Micropterus dolomieu TaxID=147949 RepID=UPI001E8D44BB|nr:RAD9, HUS1, RAD1-interacting nuclear orphan protein 1 isoform X2 [Micropterus dolomieu]